MTPRLNPYKAAPEAMNALVALENYVQESGLDHSLVDLVKTRASQINGCAYCIHMHTSEARARGETEERLYLLNAWRESPLYSERECAALAWTEAVTLVSETHVPDVVYDQGGGRACQADRREPVAVGDGSRSLIADRPRHYRRRDRRREPCRF
jgi:AhpD family alkylhydroperoxidase